jgi:hypothetical protein
MPDPSQPRPIRKAAPTLPAPGMAIKKDGTSVPESQGAPDWVSMLMQAEGEAEPGRIPRGEETFYAPQPDGAALPERQGPVATLPKDEVATDITDIGGAATGGTWSDVLRGAMKSGIGDIRSAQGDTARKAAAEQVIRSVLPQLEALGVQVEDVKNEKIKIGGVWYDLLRDVEGDAEPQFLALGANEESAAPQAGGGMGLAPGREPMQNSLIDSIRATLLELMGNGIQG